MSEELSVFLNRKPAGTLTFSGKEETFGFEYHKSWLENEEFFISPHIHLQENDSGKIKRFLANLLPEGKWLEELSVNSRISKAIFLD